MSRAATFEALLARLYTDARVRADFLAQPEAFGIAAGLDAEQVAALSRIDRVGLELMADSLEHKRRGRVRPR
jgi:hypothetical protein